MKGNPHKTMLSERNFFNLKPVISDFRHYKLSAVHKFIQMSSDKISTSCHFSNKEKCFYLKFNILE